MTEIVIPANTTVSFVPDAAGNIVQHNDLSTDDVLYSFTNDDSIRWFTLSPKNGTIRVDQTTYFKHNSSRTIRLISDKA